MLFVLSAVGGWALYTATGVGGAALAWISLRLNGALVWKTNAEGYKAELERVRTEYKDSVTLAQSAIHHLENTVNALERRIRELEARPDWPAVVTAIQGSERNVISAIANMRAEAQGQHATALVEIAAQVAERAQLTRDRAEIAGLAISTASALAATTKTTASELKKEDHAHKNPG